MKKVTLLNIISNLILQFCTIISGFIIPKLVLSYFGSEVNGLIASLNQFLSYITLIEGGVTGVITAALYKPIVERNNKKISSILNTTNKFYKKIAYFFIAYSIILAIIYPLIFNTNFSFIYVFSLTLILGISLLIQYMFSLTLRTLLIADKKIYIVSISQVLIIIINIIISIIIIKFYPNLHVFKLFNGLLYIIQPIIFNYYVKKHYKIDKTIKEDNTLIKNRWNGFAINIAAFIHGSTDIVILTIWTDLKNVSIYNVYYLVVSGLTAVINSICSAINPTIGQAYANGDINDLNKKMNIYELIVFFVVFLLFSVSGMLITPFVMIYTKGITDIDYCKLLFGILLLIGQAIYLIKIHHLGLAYSANKFIEITPHCYIEAFLNIIVSVALVGKLGLIGVAIGTIIGMLYRMIYHIHFTSKEIIKGRTQWIFYKKLIIFIIATIIGVYICNIIVNGVDYTIHSWIFHAIIYTAIMIACYVCVLLIFYRNETKELIKYLNIKK